MCHYSQNTGGPTFHMSLSGWILFLFCEINERMCLTSFKVGSRSAAAAARLDGFSSLAN